MNVASWVGVGYRMRQHAELWQTPHVPPEPESSPARRRRARQAAATI